jgi:hypothetical protein
MDASLDTLVIAAYVFADSFAIPRSGPAGKITDAELIALSVAQAAMGVELELLRFRGHLMIWGACPQGGSRDGEDEAAVSGLKCPGFGGGSV